MSLTMHDVSSPVLLRGLATLSLYLTKAAEFASDAKIAPEILINARLAPDMLSLGAQVQRASDTAKGAVARLAGVENPSFADTETTLDELQERIAKTMAFVESISAQQLADSATRTIDLPFRTQTDPLYGKEFLLKFVLPNFFFHVVTAHDILRHNGVKIGKRDFLGAY